MSETTINYGKCPQCGGKTKRTQTRSYPFPDEEEITVEEYCLTEGCDFVREGFSSTNATTNFYHYYKFGNQRNAEKKEGVSINDRKTYCSIGAKSHFHP